MANDKEFNLKITTTANTSEVKKLTTEVQQLGDAAKKAGKNTIDSQKEELGLLGKLEKQLKDLKEIRSKANNEQDIERLNKEILEAEKNLKKLNNLGVKDELSEITDETESLSDQLESLPGPAGEAVGSIKSLGAAANPATLIVAALAAAIVATFTASKESAFGLAEEAKAIQNLKNVTGVATLTAVAFTQAAKTQGIEASDLVDIFNQVAGAVSEVKAGNKDLADSFQRLGIEDLSNLDSVVKQLAKNFATLPKDIQTVSDFSKLLGEEGVKQVGLFAGEIENATQKVDEYGLANEETLKRGLDLNKALNDSTLAFQALQASIGREAAPAFTEITKNISEFIVELSKSDQSKKFFRDFAEGLLELVKFAILSKNALKDLLGVVDPLVKEFTRFDSALELIYQNTLPGAIVEITKFFNTFLLGERALADQIKKQKEYEEQLKKTSTTSISTINQQIEALAVLKNQIDQLITTNDQLLQKEKIVAEGRIQNIEKAVIEGKQKEKDAAIEIGEIRQNLANKEIQLATENRDKIALLAQQNTNLKKELADAEINLSQAVLAAEKLAIETRSKLEQIAFAEEKERIEELRKDRQSANSQELAEIKDLEDKKTITHENAAKQRREITIRELKTQIDEETNLSNNSEIGEKQREEARKRLSALIRKQAETDKQTEKEVQDAILKDVQDADKAKIASNKAVSDAAKQEADKQKALADQQKTVEKVAFDQKIAQLKASGATAEQIALETANFEIEQQQKIIAAIRVKIQIQQAANTDNKELSAELIKLDTELIAAQGKLNQLTADRTAILEKQKSAVKQLNTEGAQGNDRFAQAIADHTKSVENLADRAKSAAGSIKGGITSIAGSFDLASLSVEELQQKIEELQGNIKFITEVAAIPDKDAFIKPSLDAIDKLNQEIINKTQRVALEKAAEEARIAEEKARETAAKLLEIAQKLEEDKTKAAEKRAEDLKKVNEDIEKENIDFVTREFNRNTKLNEDKTKASEEYAKREKDILDGLAKQEEERQRKLAETKEKIQLDSQDKLNDLQRKGLVERATLEAQINAEKDPKKKAELEAQLAKVTEEGRKKEGKEKEKQAELDKLLTENLSEEELKAKQDAIERKYKLDQDADDQRQALIKSGNKKALEEFDKLIAEQKKRDEERLAAELKRIQDAAKRKKEQEDKERAERKASYDQKLNDLQEAFNKERTEAAKQHGQRLADLKKQQGEIKTEYKKTLDQITQDAIASANQLGVTGKAIQDAFGLGNNAAQKYLDTLNKIGQAQQNISNSASGGSGSSSGSSSGSIGNSSGSSSSSGNSPFGGTTPNSNSSSTGSIGSPTTPPSSGGKGIVEQPKGDKTGKQGNGGITKGNTGQSLPTPTGNIPGSIQTSGEYNKTVFALFENFDKLLGNKQKENYTTEQNKYLSESQAKVDQATNAYCKGANVDPSILKQAPKLYNFARTSKNYAAFSEQVQYVIRTVEKNRTATKGSDKTPDKASDIGSVSGDIIKPGLSSDPTGSSDGTKGDTASTGNQSGSVEPPKEQKDTRFDPKKENIGEGAEADGFVLSGPGFSGSTAPTAEEALAGKGSNDTIASNNQANVSAQIQNGLVLGQGAIQVTANLSAEQIAKAVEAQMMAIISSGQLSSQIQAGLDKQFTSNLVSRNPSSAVKL